MKEWEDLFNELLIEPFGEDFEPLSPFGEDFEPLNPFDGDLEELDPLGD